MWQRTLRCNDVAKILRRHFNTPPTIIFLMNSIIFLLIGLEVHIGSLIHSYHLVLLAVLAVLIGRAISVYLLVAILKKRLHLDLSLYTMLQILSLTLFEKIPVLQAFSQQPPATELPDVHVYRGF